MSSTSKADSAAKLPRIVVYHQTHYHKDEFVSILPLLTEKTGVTHVIIAAFHLLSPTKIHLNDHPYDDPINAPLWDEVRTLKQNGVQVLGMLGGDYQGSFTKLDGTHRKFNDYYQPLRRMIEWAGLEGLDLDVEEAFSLGGIVRLIDHLRNDFGPGFLITLAPVAPAMMNLQNVSGFEYDTLEKGLGARINWYNTQFYCGWGDMSKTDGYEAIIHRGWPPEKVVAGLVTNPASCAGWVDDEDLGETLKELLSKYPDFGGVMGWEYFNSITSAHPKEGKPWVWAKFMREHLHNRPRTSSS